MIIEGDEVGPAQPAFHEPVLARPDPLDAMHVPCDLTKRICSITFPGTEVREETGERRAEECSDVAMFVTACGDVAVFVTSADESQCRVGWGGPEAAVEAALGHFAVGLQ